MNIKTKIKLAAVTGIASLIIGCSDETPVTQKESTIYIPKECEKIKLLDDTHSGWNLLCEDNQGNDIFYHGRGNLLYSSNPDDHFWNKYNIEKK